MLNRTPTALASGAELLHYVSELLHRVSNEYAKAISLVSVIASRLSSREVRSALENVIEHLSRLAKLDRVLSPPFADGATELREYLHPAMSSQGRGATHAARRDDTPRYPVVGCTRQWVSVSPSAGRRALDE